MIRKTFKLIRGVGINDADYQVSWRENGKIKYCPFYRKWVDVLARCYVQSKIDLFPSYNGCTVCEEWLTFSNFKAWMETQDWEGKELDKDLLIPGNKVYSPETCVFVSQELNSFVLDRKALRGAYPLGVSLHRKSGKYRARCCIGKGKAITIGYFDNPTEAHIAWKECKLKLAKEHAKEINNEKLVKALINRYT